MARRLVTVRDSVAREHLKLPSFESGVIDMLELSETARQSHLRARLIWARVSSCLLAATALAGAFSGATVIADNRDAAVVLGIATALLAGLSAGLQPADKAAQHQVAAVGYGAVVIEVQKLLIDREAEGATDWKKLRPGFVKVMERFARVEASAPHVHPWKSNLRAARVRIRRILGLEDPTTYGDSHSDRDDRRRVSGGST